MIQISHQAVGFVSKKIGVDYRTTGQVAITTAVVRLGCFGYFGN